MTTMATANGILAWHLQWPGKEHACTWKTEASWDGHPDISTSVCGLLLRSSSSIVSLHRRSFAPQCRKVPRLL